MIDFIQQYSSLFLEKKCKNQISTSFIYECEFKCCFCNYVSGFPEYTRDQVEQLEDRYVLAINSFRPDVGKYRYYVSDIISPKVPLSVEFRCLHYSHLVIGDTPLVVAYITDYSKPHKIVYYLNIHENSPFVNFSRTSVRLPIGREFKVLVFDHPNRRL